MNTNRKTARIAGFLYFFYIVATMFANVSRTKLIVFGDAMATANRIRASEWLFRIGFVSDVVAGVLFLLAAWA